MRTGRKRSTSTEAPESEWNDRISPVTAVYGPNASGKSSLLDALSEMVRMVDRSAATSKPTEKVAFSPFLLDADSRTEPTRYELEFLMQGVRHQYGFEHDANQYLKEWLYAYPKARRQTLFERNSDESDPWYFGKGLGGPNRLIAESTRDNSLFISAAAGLKHPRLSKIYSYFGTNLRFVKPTNQDQRTRYTMNLIEKDRTLAAKATALLRHADLGISDIQVRHHDLGEEDAALMRRLMTAISREISPDQPAEKQDDVATEKLFSQMRNEFELEHIGIDGEKFSLPFEYESLGTKSLVSFTGPVIKALEEGNTLVVDEVDTSLHPRVVAEIVRLFQSPKSNPAQAQLIFSTHDTTLLASSGDESPVLDRDQVWFVEKGRNGASRVYALSEYSPRRLENLERGYLQGRYGAVPYVNHRKIAGAISGDVEVGTV
ncbi:AAA family ATPase [Paenarthrobacter sp. NyZ202]|uniref:AAA family ATPase n=1 Tax=Paenarthrobacter sp. NyZ202 TaxID=3402689 RepID=UPI003CF83090